MVQNCSIDIYNQNDITMIYFCKYAFFKTKEFMESINQKSNIVEIQKKSFSGIGFTILAGTGMLLSLSMLGQGNSNIVWILLMSLFAFGFSGLYIVNPNEAKALLFFGTYKGTVKTQGLRWNNPLYSKLNVSLKIRNFESPKLKVNDKDGNPIEIASIIVWKVTDTAEALFQIDDFEKYVHIQAEAAIRNLAMKYPYDAHSSDSKEISLHGSPDIVVQQLKEEVRNRLESAGVDIIDARLSHLAYSAEIAAIMLQRQQASAIIGARQKIVEGAVGMVEMALNRLSEKQIVTLDDERKAAMVSNLLVVLCGEKSANPIINAGTIY